MTKRYQGRKKNEEYLVEGAVGRSEALDTTGFAKGLLEGHAESDGGIFGSVVIVNVEVTLAL